MADDVPTEELKRAMRCTDPRGHQFPIKPGKPFPPACTNCGVTMAKAFEAEKYIPGQSWRRGE